MTHQPARRAPSALARYTPVLTALVLALACVVAPAVTRAQVLQIYVEAHDAAGRPFADLTTADFQVAEDDILTDIVSADRGAGPMKIALLVDNSRQISRDIGEFRRGLRAFLDTLASGHEIGLFTIAGPPRRLVDFTTDRGALGRQVDRLFANPDAGSHVFDGVQETWERRFDDDDPFPVFVLVVTDHRETSGFISVDDQQGLLREFAMADATVHAVLISISGGSGVTSIADNLTGATGGLMETINLTSGLDRALGRLADRLNTHYDRVSTWYRIRFERTDPPGRALSVGIARPDAQVNVFFSRRLIP